MKTQIEQIKWHKYPDSKPRNSNRYLASWINFGGYHWVGVLWYGKLSKHSGIWEIDGGELFDMDLIAWAKIPKGWIKKKMKIQIEQCEYCGWVRSEPCFPINDICVNDNSPYYMIIVNTDIINTCDMFEELIKKRNKIT